MTGKGTTKQAYIRLMKGVTVMEKKVQSPVLEKANLTLEEAAAYTGIEKTD